MKHFHPLQTDIARPEQFNDPFDYEPHPLSILAVEEVQRYIMEHPEIKEDADQGKMFGVLVVYLPRKDEGERRKEITSEIQDEGAAGGNHRQDPESLQIFPKKLCTFYSVSATIIL